MIDKAVPIFMMLSGYVMVLSAPVGGIRQFYMPGKIWRRLIRLTIPTSIAFGVYIVINFIRGKEAITCIWIIKRFLMGDYGQGAYYYALMLEFLVFSPIILWFVKEWEVHGIILIGLLNFLYDIFSSAYNLPAPIYRVLIFRYLLIIALGMYTGMKKEVKNEVLGLMLIVGMIYILLPIYWGYDYHIFTYMPWGRTSMIAVFYVFPVIYILLRHLSELKVSNRMCVCGGIAVIGQASYHIMYTQMLYYYVKGYMRFHFKDFGNVLGGFLELTCNIVISVLIGILFWYIDRKFLSGKIIKWRN